jgi:sterol desaturase/sphingolipid hydroxylase (fatty acid hydroxylase superfamily)
MCPDFSIVVVDRAFPLLLLAAHLAIMGVDLTVVPVDVPLDGFVVAINLTVVLIDRLFLLASRLAHDALILGRCHASHHMTSPLQ